MSSSATPNSADFRVTASMILFVSACASAMVCPNARVRRHSHIRRGRHFRRALHDLHVVSVGKASAGMAISAAQSQIFFMFVFLLFVFHRGCRLILFMLQTIRRNLFPLKHYFFLYSAKDKTAVIIVSIFLISRQIGVGLFLNFLAVVKVMAFRHAEIDSSPLNTRRCIHSVGGLHALANTAFPSLIS